MNSRLTRRNFLKVAGGLAGGAALSACGVGPGTTPAPEAKQMPVTAAPATKVAKPAGVSRSKTFVVGLEQEAVNLDPIAYTSSGERTQIRNIYEGLTDIEGTDIYAKPCLATDWIKSPDGLEYVFNLRKGVKFHDGTPFNAEAVKYCIEAYKTANARFVPYCPTIDHVEVVDELKAKFVLTAPSATLLEGLQWWTMFSPTAAQKFTTAKERIEWFGAHSAGTGPWVLDTWDHGQQIVLSKNEDYWRGWMGNHVEKVICRVIEEFSTQRMLLEQGEIDLAQKVPVDAVEALRKNSNINMQVYPIARLFNLMMNVTKSQTADRRIREAIAYAFDYDTHQATMRGYPGQAPGGPIPPELTGGVTPEMPVRRRDLTKAKALMKEAGFPNGGFTLDMVSLGVMFEEHTKLAQVVYNSLAELGIEVKINNLLSTAWLDLMSNPDTALPLWPHYASSYAPIPTAFLQYLYHSRARGKGGNNWSYYSNPEVDKLIDTIDRELDDTKRVQMLRQACVLIEKDCVAVRVNRTVGMEAARTWVKNWIPRPYFLLGQKYYELYNEGKPD